MKKLIVALASAALLLAACTPDSGKPFDELPAVEQDAVWQFFAALPASVLPDDIKPAEDRLAYRTKFHEMMDGVLGDGEGPEDETQTSNNTIYWSDYFAKPVDFDWASEDPDTPRPYVNFHVYPGTAEGKLYGVLRRGTYIDGDEKKEPDSAYWFDVASGKVKPGNIVLEPPYTADDITPDPLLVYGCNGLHFSLQDGKFGPYYHDRGFNVYIDDVGVTGVEYEWNGVSFTRLENPVQRVIYNYGFAHIMLGEDVPWSVPGYSTLTVSEENPFDRIFKLEVKDAFEPTLIFHASDEYKLTEIEVCSPKYANPYGIGPGSLVSDLLQKRKEFNKLFEEETSLSVVEQDNDFVHIYLGFDEDFIYMVKKDDWLGGEKFKDNARIARVAVINAMG